MKRIVMYFCLVGCLIALAACSNSNQTSGERVDLIDSNESEELGTDEVLESEETVENSEDEESSTSDDVDRVDNEDSEFERFEYEGAWPGVGIEVDSPEEALKGDLELFFETVIDELGNEYVFRLGSVMRAVDQQMTIPIHYKFFMDDTPQRIRDLKRLTLETDEADFIRQYYLQAMEIHLEAVENIHPHIDDIHNDTHDEHVTTEFYDKILEGYHYLALSSIQIIKIAEETNVLDINEMNDLEDMIEEYLMEKRL
ncbi:hypothetical protein [Evansella cellulosilytica]|uniref:Lipoprotein n=1 Tax=Evansella cellulosilytica (strain ATCC 21833 / DSM 2522 / FERM P-1141 / JCM 9156 / N-4) TaxID=649639 RepID=E6TRR6_EVAC2|nr:hypothetical protein [Evansella cellulosilytica]ADU29439.1 hypothetical protein Bcell_1174 [Evansella cellulosilytica DSM 2522]